MKPKPNSIELCNRESVGMLTHCRISGIKGGDAEEIFVVRDITQEDVGKVGFFCYLDGYDIHPTGNDFIE